MADHGPAKVVTACNVLAHVEDIDEVMRAIDILLADDGVLVAENHDLASVVDGGQWDTVYHEHLRFFDPHSFHLLLDKHGFGSLRVAADPDARRLVPDAGEEGLRAGTCRRLAPATTSRSSRRTPQTQGTQIRRCGHRGVRHRRDREGDDDHQLLRPRR